MTLTVLVITRLPKFDGIITQRGEPFVQFSGPIEQLLGVIGERLLLQGIGHGFPARPERDRGEPLFLRRTSSISVGIGFERGLQWCLIGDEGTTNRVLHQKQFNDLFAGMHARATPWHGAAANPSRRATSSGAGGVRDFAVRW